MIAQRGPAAPVLAGPMKFSIGSYKDRTNRERPEPLRILSEPENVIPSMPVPESPPPPPPPTSTVPAVVKLNKIVVAKRVPKIDVRVEPAARSSPVPPVQSPAKFDAVLLPEKPVYIIPKNSSPSPVPPPLPSKSELRKSAEISEFNFASAVPAQPQLPPPLPLKSETLKKIFPSTREGSVSPSPKPNVPAKPGRDLLSNQVHICSF